MAPYRLNSTHQPICRTSLKILNNNSESDSKIRCRVFRTWKAAEDYYSNSLRELARAFREGRVGAQSGIEDDEEEPIPMVTESAVEKALPNGVSR